MDFVEYACLGGEIMIFDVKKKRPVIQGSVGSTAKLFPTCTRCGLDCGTFERGFARGYKGEALCNPNVKGLRNCYQEYLSEQNSSI